ncbi:hypothetical protein QE389_001987 [Brevundimonas sp. SORGH_AS 993]|nr:hypothetical protein [Brevundimonas sp. SORGH_AS_0993]
MLSLDRDGVLDRLFEAVAAEPDLEWVMLDATVIRLMPRPPARG